MSDSKIQDNQKMARAIEELTKQIAQLSERVEEIERGIKQEKDGLLAWVG